MTQLNLAESLAEAGLFVFPVAHNTEENTKKPLTSHGHNDATQDPGTLRAWWEKWPTARVGVAAGKSGIVVADIDRKNGKDGFESLDSAWLEIPETFAYDTSTGGRHLVYRAPEGKNLTGNADYRGMVGVDRRGGSSWVMWAGEVPSAEEITDAPEWLCDEAKERSVQGFDGTVDEWYSTLTPGDPNALVRHALKRINPDYGHSEMVEATYEAIRLGCEGNAGVPDLLDAILEAWMDRPAENHTTPESEWLHKFQEAVVLGIEKYGELTDLVKNLPDYSLAMVPASVPDNLITGSSAGKTGFSQALGALIKEIDSNDRIASILWNAPATRDLARDWGLEFVHQRIQEARKRPEPTRENPRLEEKRAEKEPTTATEPVEREDDRIELLTQGERDFLKERPTFVDSFEGVATEMGYDQMRYFRSAGWILASMGFSFHGFVPVRGTKKHGLNLWNITMGESGTGKTIVQELRDEAMRCMFDGDNEGGASYDLGSDSSPQGLHAALIERDKKASFFGADEASGWFKTLGKKEWDAGLSDTLSKWYNGFVPPANKMNLKELKGKSALTSFNIQMFATPDRLVDSLDREMFLSGFLARFNWVIGDPPVETDDRYEFVQDLQHVVEEEGGVPEVIQKIVSDLIGARAFTERKPVPLIATEEARKRVSVATKKMHLSARGRDNFDVVEPSIVRLTEAVYRCAGICAMYRSDTEISMTDALHAIQAVEEWFNNLFVVAELISQGDFQRHVSEIEEWIISRGGKATKAQLFHRFRNMIEKDARELDSRINYLVESGLLNKLEGERGAVRYELNGA